VAALVVASAKLVGAFVVVVACALVVVVGAFVVGALVVAVTFTQAHLSAGSGRPKSYQCKYPGLHVQQLRVGATVLSAALVAARVVGALVVVVVVGDLVVVVVVGALVVVVVGAFVVVVGALVVVVVVGALVVPVGMEEAATTPATGMYPFSMFTMLTPRWILNVPLLPHPVPQELTPIQ